MVINRRIVRFAKKYLYMVFLGIAIGYGIFYTIYVFNATLYGALKDYDQALKYFSEISIFFFTAGIFSASLKYLQFLGVFETEFKKVVMSEEFDEKLKQQLKQITFSESFLLKQSNLEEIWETVTLCKYNKQFPALYHKLRKKIRNTFFVKNNISYYYKNFQVNYNIRLQDDGLVLIEDSSSYTLVRPNEESFEWDFSVNYFKDDEGRTKARLTSLVTNMDHEQIVNEFESAAEELVNGTLKKEIKEDLTGQLEYHIERSIEVYQDIDKDRVFSFSCDRIIDDLSFTVKHCNGLGVYVEPVRGNKLYHNGAFGDEELAYINRDLFLPGEKFKLFIFRK